ncbi:hypothetical protein P872_22470 [Rhodonellum psychrophilum GCM71 = DSM 17998]|uniref:Uncharacterized protein n=1 Tax=Rhodonellum psychrophilum GCM71 = DSM 17998 TaxID=1123057 RepID=U5C493_9BACT|nr:hypothetical protein P872_22470 [Rhodonellum psychrophilum GCM71 = DSM 17998]
MQRGGNGRIRLFGTRNQSILNLENKVKGLDLDSCWLILD